MKLSTSTSTSTSTSASTSSNTSMCNSKKTTTTAAGCLTSILRKILCSGDLPKDPSNQIEELDSSNSMASEKNQNLNAEAAPAATPGIVARLMGLESMGEIQIPYALSKPSSLSRSRSMNSVDYLGECKQMEGLHKRVNSTLSFREAPNFLLSESENFLVLSFASGGENSKAFKSNGRKKQMGCEELKQKVVTERGENSKAFKSNGRKKQMGCEELKQKVVTERGEVMENKRGEKGKMSKKGSDMSCGNVGNQCKLQDITNTSHRFKASVEKKCFDSEAVKLSQHMNCKEVVGVGKKQKRKKKRTHCYTENKVEIECKSEDSSPVSVLDFERESCGSGAAGLSSRRKLTPELENDRPLLLRSDGNLMIDERKVKAIESNKYEGSKKKEKHSQEYVDTWGEVCRLVEDELGGTNQIHAWMNKQSDLGSISADFESEIFDQLLNELIDQFVGHPPLTSL